MKNHALQVYQARQRSSPGIIEAVLAAAVLNINAERFQGRTVADGFQPSDAEAFYPGPSVVFAHGGLNTYPPSVAILKRLGLFVFSAPGYAYLFVRTAQIIVFLSFLNRASGKIGTGFTVGERKTDTDSFSLLHSCRTLAAGAGSDPASSKEPIVGAINSTPCSLACSWFSSLP